jgi:hypothetical protein
LNKLLVFNPYFRPTIDECLEHPYLKKLRNLDNESEAEEEIFLDIEKMTDLNLEKLKELFV